MLVCVGGKEKRSSSIFKHSFECVWRKDMLRKFSTHAKIKRICRLHCVSWLVALDDFLLVFLFTVRIFFFFIIFLFVIFLRTLLFFDNDFFVLTIRSLTNCNAFFVAKERKLNRSCFCGYFIIRSLHQASYFLLSFSFEISTRFLEVRFDRILERYIIFDIFHHVNAGT